MTRQSDAIGQSFKTAVADELGVKPAFDPFEHELDELAVKQGTNRTCDPIGVDRDTGRKRIDVSSDRGNANYQEDTDEALHWAGVSICSLAAATGILPVQEAIDIAFSPPYPLPVKKKSFTPNGNSGLFIVWF